MDPLWFRRKSKETAALPEIEVDEAEFVRLFTEAGGKPEDAHMHARVSRGLGSHVHIGNQMVRCKE